MADDRFHHRAGAQPGRWRTQGKRGADAQGLGRSRGGLSTKIHAASDALGNPVRLIGSPGQRNDITFAHDLIDAFVAEGVIADKGYDADHLCDKIAETGAQIVIPPKRNRKVQRAYDIDLYKERNLIERFFNKLKQFRRIATRYDKLLVNFMGFVKLAAIAIWLRWLNRHYSLGRSPRRRHRWLPACCLRSVAVCRRRSRGPVRISSGPWESI